nr:14267_t:CDS:2 [Entrophospora candida]CAG8625643.1 13486_t:CDS:2 [Entrophospora candida]
MSEWDDAVLSVAIIDCSFFSETINREELDSTDNILDTFKVLFQVSKRYDKIITLVRIIKGVIGRLAIPILIRSFKEGLDDDAVMTRTLTFGAPILQEFGINFLTLLLYGVMILMLSFQISRTIANKLEDKIEIVFLIAIITIRTFGPVRLNCGGLDIGSAFCSGINLWFAVQSMIWAVKGVNILEYGVPFWKPF